MKPRLLLLVTSLALVAASLGKLIPNGFPDGH